MSVRQNTINDALSHVANAPDVDHPSPSDPACALSVVYGFFHTSCIYESASALVSLHKSKKGAVRAMIAHQYAQWLEAQTQGRIFSRKEVARMQLESGPFQWTRKDSFWRKAYLHKASHVAPVNVAS